MPIPPHILSLRQKIGHTLLHLPGVSTIVVNPQGHVLLQKRADLHIWHTLGGCIDPGESLAHAAIREVLEETGLHIKIIRLTGVYALPTITYPNGDQASYISTTFLCEPLGDTEPKICDDESLALQYFPPTDLPPLLPDALKRIKHALSNRPEAYYDLDQ